MNTSFEEKSVWLQLLSVVVVLGAYFVLAGRMLAEGVTVLAAYAAPFLVATALMAVVLTIGHVAAAVLGRPEPPDERDRLIAWRAQSRTSWVLVIGIFGALTALFFSLEAVWVAHILVLSLFVAEVARFLFQLVYYRRGL